MDGPSRKGNDASLQEWGERKQRFVLWTVEGRAFTRERGVIAAARPLDGANRSVQLLVAGVCVCDRRDRVAVPREALGEEEILRRAVDVRARGVPKSVEVVDRLEARLPAIMTF